MRRAKANASDGLKGLSSGIDALDVALGGHGYRFGQLVEIQGAPGTGKTSLALRATVAACRARQNVLFVDADRSLFNKALSELDGASGRVWSCHPASTQEACRIARLCLRSGAFGLIVFDSACALPAQSEHGRWSESSCVQRLQGLAQEVAVLARLAGRVHAVVLITRQLSASGCRRRAGRHLEMAYCASTCVAISSVGKSREIVVLRSIDGSAGAEPRVHWPRESTTGMSRMHGWSLLEKKAG